jgi:hypothetical protein
MLSIFYEDSHSQHVIEHKPNGSLFQGYKISSDVFDSILQRNRANRRGKERKRE